MKQIRSWGVIWSEAIPRAGDWRCQNSECRWDFNAEDDSAQYVVGFTTDGAYPSSLGGEMRVGRIIIECPDCFEKFYFHVTADTVDSIRDNCAVWPKEGI